MRLYVIAHNMSLNHILKCYKTALYKLIQNEQIMGLAIHQACFLVTMENRVKNKTKLKKKWKKI